MPRRTRARTVLTVQALGVHWLGVREARPSLA